MKKLHFNLKYLSNFKRINLGEYNLTADSITLEILNNHIKNIDGTLDDNLGLSALRIETENGYKKITQKDIDIAISTGTVLNLLYSNVVPPYGAKVVKVLENGVILFFHTNEQHHSPHIHAKYAEQEISIELTPNARVTGTMKKSKQKSACNHVKAHLKELLGRWETELNINKQYK